MKQPRKCVLREQLALAADEIMRLRRERELVDAIADHWEQQAHRRSWRGRVRAWWRRVRHGGRSRMIDRGEA